ncbi:K+-dependent Na+/Ca+ exchanger-like protein [Candidatus Vecturithrix granuli]|uniref:K+-dependent Na+/Ca+ exchanger-like protein n=1 Tax=Vecturithrix granuli TaxID=1499967 RepID=A0A0S6W6Z7_VECG1|nr:K+-dependent Na+/Ca+ exchanger-like protein [Candidatus Vecturithrix granuli]
MEVLFWIVLIGLLLLEGREPFIQLRQRQDKINGTTAKWFFKNYPQVGGLLLALVVVFFSLHLAQALLGIVLLIRAADVLISGAEVIALKANIPPIVIGVVIIGLGTSMPEFFVNIISALNSNTDLAFGNIVGSNISNMGFVVGIAGWIAGRIHIQKSVITAEMPVMLASTLLIIFQVLDVPPFGYAAIRPNLSAQDGLVMLLGLSMYLLYTFHVIADVPPNPQVGQKYEERYGRQEQFHAWLKALSQIGLGIAGLYLGGEFTVSGATAIAVGLGAGTLVVGVIIGVGTSLPELAAAIASVLKNQMDLVIGNVVGSNIFNILLILGITSLIEPIQLNSGIVGHLVFLLITTILFFIALGTKRELSRLEAQLLTFLGAGYLIYSFATG